MFVLFALVFACFMLSGCQPLPVTIENNSGQVIGAILTKRKPPGFEASFNKHEFVRPGQSKRISHCHMVTGVNGHVKFYSPDGLIDVLPISCGDRYVISKTKTGYKVTHDISHRDYGAIPLNTYGYLRSLEGFIFYFFWVFIMALFWFVLLLTGTLTDYFARKEKSFAAKLSKHYKKVSLVLLLFIFLATGVSYLITRAKAINNLREQQKYAETIREWETVRSSLLREKEMTKCKP